MISGSITSIAVSRLGVLREVRSDCPDDANLGVESIG